MIVCIGWGSLIWCGKALPVRGNWRPDGPALPIEFARESRDQRITLVVCDTAAPVTTLWTELDVEDLEGAKRALAEREGIAEHNIRHSIGHWSRNGHSGHLGAETIGEWAKAKGADGAAWTALKPKIGDDYRVPSVDEVVAHLSALSGIARDAAEEYVRLAPRQIATPYRTAIEEVLDWTATGLI